MSQLKISRRTLLKGFGMGAAGLGLLRLPNGISWAQISPTDQSVAAFFRFALGDFRLTVISDAAFAFPATFFGANAEADAVNQFFDELYLLQPDGNVSVTVLNLVLETPDGIFLFDTGNGAGVGKLAVTLESLGITPDAVTGVIMSHLHPDHINGLSSNGVLTYPNAMVYYPQPEFDFMQVGPAEAVGDSVAKLQPALDAEQVVFFNTEDEVIPGVQALATPGHTPGHMSFLISSNGNNLLAVVDSVINPYSALQHPDWAFGFDGDPVQAIDTRTALLGRAASEKLQVFGYHFPFPGLGYVVPTGNTDEWRWIPAAY